MRCPYCADEGSRVIDSRLARDGAEIRRRRECIECERRFTTRERVDDVMPKVAKRDERREDFNREKLIVAIQKACEKRPVSTDALEKVVDRVERYVQELGVKEVSSGSIGDRVMEELKALDALAAARFASVFRNFQDAGDYARFFDSLRATGGAGR
ncbi:MAG: transcriptional regulator NrdR [Myxococcota bacterium]|nr:transcriptional regulator NrdR [Deltaproteobacteria bacterium]MCP4244965.1 transcriptional repressor NrdR [bacterium]MDP6076219.1 transcriptional regulator NrdR [Myxococcota bacterium]MDP6242215.1 transcriptional regulator NrdR [Myxococcota bacterium]MDP7074925.1 transcriptional regulator NrdR [Myxococcota bacterium]